MKKVRHNEMVPGRNYRLVIEGVTEDGMYGCKLRTSSGMISSSALGALIDEGATVEELEAPYVEPKWEFGDNALDADTGSFVAAYIPDCSDDDMPWMKPFSSGLGATWVSREALPEKLKKREWK